MLHLPYQQLPHHQSQGNVSDCNVSDTVSESSDNATLMSLSLTDLTALGAGQLREDIRVNRKKLESLIIRGKWIASSSFHLISFIWHIWITSLGLRLHIYNQSTLDSLSDTVQCWLNVLTWRDDVAVFMKGKGNVYKQLRLLASHFNTAPFISLFVRTKWGMLMISWNIVKIFLSCHKNGSS